MAALALALSFAACGAEPEPPAIAASAIPAAPSWLDAAGEDLAFHAVLLIAHRRSACDAADASAARDDASHVPGQATLHREYAALCDAYSVALKEAEDLYPKAKSTEMYGFGLLHTDPETRRLEKRTIGPFGLQGMCEQYEAKVRVAGAETTRCRPMR